MFPIVIYFKFFLHIYLTFIEFINIFLNFFYLNFLNF